MFTSEEGFPLVNMFPFKSTKTISSSFRFDNDFKVGVIAIISPLSPLNLALIFPAFPETKPFS